MKNKAGRPKGYSPNNPGIAAMRAAINAKKAERKRISEDVKELTEHLLAFQRALLKLRRSKRARKASAPKPKTLYGVNATKKSKKSK